MPAEQAVHILEGLDAARVSDAENRVVDLPPNWPERQVRALAFRRSA